MAAPNWCFLIADAASFFSFQGVSIVEQPVPNPYWSVLKVCIRQKCFLSHSAMVYWKVFHTVSNIQSYQFKARSPTGLPGFRCSTSWAIFHRVGNTLLFEAELKTSSSISGLARYMMVHTLLGIPFSPRAFLAWSWARSTTASISAAVNSGESSSTPRVVITSVESCGNRWSMIIPTASNSIRSAVMKGESTFFIMIWYGRPKGSCSVV